MIFGDFTKSNLEKWLEKKGMETEIRENVDIFCKVTGYFINGYFTKNVHIFCKVTGYFINGYFTKRW